MGFMLYRVTGVGYGLRHFPIVLLKTEKVKI